MTGPINYYNVHGSVTMSNLQALLNDHMTKGYRLHHIRGNGPNYAVVFVREFASLQERDAFMADREARRHTPPTTGDQRRAKKDPAPPNH